MKEQLRRQKQRKIYKVIRLTNTYMLIMLTFILVITSCRLSHTSEYYALKNFSDVLMPKNSYTTDLILPSVYDYKVIKESVYPKLNKDSIYCLEDNSNKIINVSDKYMSNFKDNNYTSETINLKEQGSYSCIETYY